MDWPLIIAVILIVLIGGSAAAIAWWRIAAGMAPYKDETKGGPAGKGRGRDTDVEEVVIKRNEVPPG